MLWIEGRLLGVFVVCSRSGRRSSRSVFGVFEGEGRGIFHADTHPNALNWGKPTSSASGVGADAEGIHRAF
ncbi:hypothetical protein GQ55_1G100400 [Panicum hallii var. hallii]|uniref:Uncharacterized protein n=1 Tax=Panicum hallii var. hallii TaxID=1504633 RepID=A0A2T7F464_9POAL|nr:hypothetical protein GQ55_1G100400 [Panicum hallii var. hallii]